MSKPEYDKLSVSFEAELEKLVCVEDENASLTVLDLAIKRRHIIEKLLKIGKPDHMDEKAWNLLSTQSQIHTMIKKSNHPLVKSFLGNIKHHNHKQLENHLIIVLKICDEILNRFFCGLPIEKKMFEFNGEKNVYQCLDLVYIEMISESQ